MICGDTIFFTRFVDKNYVLLTTAGRHHEQQKQFLEQQSTLFCTVILVNLKHRPTSCVDGSFKETEVCAFVQWETKLGSSAWSLE
jgi:hypothetical protein